MFIAHVKVHVEEYDLSTHATKYKANIVVLRYQESEGSDFGEEEEDSDAEAPRKLHSYQLVQYFLIPSQPQRRRPSEPPSPRMPTKRKRMRMRKPS